MTRSKKILFSLFFLAVVAVLIEGGLRVGGFEYHQKTPSLDFLGVDLGREEIREFFRHDPDLFWELIPGARVSTRKMPYEFANSLGFRGWEVKPEKPEGTVRIAALGDSCTYGFAVPMLETYPFRLEAMLLRLGRDVEMINGGVPGYSSHQIRQRFEKDVLPLQPDIVILYMGQWNDFTPAVGASDREKALSGSMERDVTAEGVDYGGVRLAQLVALGTSPIRERIRKRREGQYRQSFRKGDLLDGCRVPLSDFREHLRAMATQCVDRGISLYLIPGPLTRKGTEDFPVVRQYWECVGEVATEFQATVVDVLPGVRALGDEEAFDDWVHPSSKGHESIATTIFRAFCDRGELGLEPGTLVPDGEFESVPLASHLAAGKGKAKGKGRWLDVEERERLEIDHDVYEIELPGSVKFEDVQIGKRTLLKWSLLAHGETKRISRFRYRWMVKGEDGKRTLAAKSQCQSPGGEPGYRRYDERAYLVNHAGQRVTLEIEAKRTQGVESEDRLFLATPELVHIP